MRGAVTESSRRRRLTAAAACCALAASAAWGGDSKSDTAWPWGAPPAGAASLRESKRDLYNLGMLGAKASDADRAPAPETQQSGVRAVAVSGDAGADAGP